MKYLISYFNDIRSLKWVCQNIQYGADVYNQNAKTMATIMFSFYI